MSDEAARLAEGQAREGDLVSNRIGELHETPIGGNFDAAHLQAVHAYLFQDLPRHRPGVFRADTESWIKARALEGQAISHVVAYAHENIEARISGILGAFGGAATLKGLSLEAAAGRMATLYGDLDHAHGFYEGNSRTLREFMRTLALTAGYTLDWTGTAVGAAERNALYVARDVAVLERAFPGLTRERTMRTTDHAEYEASFALDRLRRAMGDKSLETILRERRTPHR